MVRRNLAQNAFVIIVALRILAPGPRVVVPRLLRQQRIVVFVRASHTPRLREPTTIPTPEYVSRRLIRPGAGVGFQTGASTPNRAQRLQVCCV